jgi:hypothetical protein
MTSLPRGDGAQAVALQNGADHIQMVYRFDTGGSSTWWLGRSVA